MIKMKINPLFILFAFLWTALPAAGQDFAAEENKNIFLAFDDAIGAENTKIFNGVEYIEKHRMINEKHKFFQSNNFVQGTVYYEGQPFFNVPLKYNIFEDLVIVSPQERKWQNAYRLFENKLEAFELHGKKFININSLEAPIKGIYQLLYDDENIQLLKKYRTKEKMIRKDAFVHYEFREQKPKYYFFQDGEYWELNRGNLLKVFPDHRSVLLEKFRNFRKHSGERRDQAAVSLFQTFSQQNN
jgi:hypothetical protein